MSDYILVIHGTWNPPETWDLSEDRKLKWFQFNQNDNQNFCNRLNQALAGSALHDAVWRQCTPGTKVTFDWTGDNTHEAREEGAKNLCDLLWKIRRADPQAQIHLIAHSHGGNVLLRAIELYFARLEAEARWIVESAVRKVQDNKAPADAINEALIEVCGDELSKASTLRNLTDKFILQGLQEWSEARSQRSFSDQFRRINLSVRHTPLVRQVFGPYKKFYAAWSQSLESRCLGRFVFMGTPFYYKRWLPGSRVSRGVTFLINLVLSVIVMGVVWYLMILFWAGGLSLLPWVHFVGFNPWGWPVWLLVFLGFGFVSGAIGEMTSQEYHDVNLYYTTASSKPVGTLSDDAQPMFPIKALVLSAGLLDEALMAMSIEPIVYGFLSPTLKKRLEPDFFPSAPPIRSGEEDTMLTGLKRSIQFVAHRVSAPITAVLSRALRWWTQPRLTEFMLDTASSAGFGLPIQEFSNAVVTPREDLEVPGVFEAGEVVDVSQLFAEARLTTRSPATPARFDFLWNDTALHERLKASFTWQKVEPYCNELKARMGRDDKWLVEKLPRLCALIDVRVREFGNMVELFHSGYYADQKVIEAIAEFLKTGDRPPADHFRKPKEG